MRRGPAWALLLASCAQDEMTLRSHLDVGARIRVQAPLARLRGGCESSFDARFCAEEYEPIGVVTVGAGDAARLALAEPVTDAQCTNLLWLSVVSVGEVGPIDDAGTLFELPVDAELERGAGALHAAAFPELTVRLDEVGALDARQALPPLPCAELGRTPR